MTAADAAEHDPKDSFWGGAGVSAPLTEAARRPRDIGTQQVEADATKVEPQPTTPKATRPASGRDVAGAKDPATARQQRTKPASVPPPDQKVEGKEMLDDDDDDSEEEEEDDMLPEAKPSFARNEVAPGEARFRQNAVHVYGLDFLRTGHMDEIFSQFNHKFVEWINDSSANIVFVDATSAKKALESLSFPKSGDPPWRRTPDILVSEDVPPIFLQMRLATPTDVKASKRSIPPAVLIQSPAPGRRQAADSAPRLQLYADGPLGDEVERPPSKRKAAPSNEELLKRRKRAERFGEREPTCGIPVEGDAPAEEPVRPAVVGSITSETTPKNTPGSGALPGIEATEEELSKRRGRASRFGTGSGTDAQPDAEAVGGDKQGNIGDKPVGNAVEVAAPTADAPEPTAPAASTGEAAGKD